jgi:glucose/arabinose dehydrogenase
MRWLLIAAGAALFGNARGQGAPGVVPFPTSCTGVSAARFQYTLNSDWKVTKIGTGLTQPRTVIFDPLGNMLILEATKGISVHSFGPDGCISSSTSLFENRALNHGLVLTPDGKTLYASSETTAWQWSYDPATKKLSNQKVVIKGISSGIHTTRTVAIAPSNPNLLLLSVGSNANFDMQTISPSTGRSCIKSFDMSKVPEGGSSYNTQGTMFGYGMRNEIGVAFDPAGNAWGVENSGDDFRRTVNGQATDIHIDNPAEELNYLGDPTKENNNWYGYPTCFTAWDASAIKDISIKTGEQFVVSPNSSFNDASCTGKATPPRLSFPAHSAPIAAAFDANGANLYVTFHGSWNRQPATGYKVIQIPFVKNANGGYEPAAASDSMKGFTDVIAASNPGGCQSQTLTRSSCWRPAALAWDPSGTRLFFSSDNQAEGELFVLAKK